jgi:uncharacterized protein (DUF2141 family)
LKHTHRLALAAMLTGWMIVPVRAADAPAPVSLSVSFDGLRSAKGVIRACLTRNAKLFLKCERDPEALNMTVAAGPGAHMAFANVRPGDYVLAVVHDENSNSKVDTFLGIPREGVGFSRNPGMSFGPPKWDSARFQVAAEPVTLRVKLKYFL